MTGFELLLGAALLAAGIGFDRWILYRGEWRALERRRREVEAAAEKGREIERLGRRIG